MPIRSSDSEPPYKIRAENPKSHRNLNQEGFKMGHPTINPQIIVILTLKANIYRVLDKYTWYSKISESKT